MTVKKMKYIFILQGVGERGDYVSEKEWVKNMEASMERRLQGWGDGIKVKMMAFTDSD